MHLHKYIALYVTSQNGLEIAKAGQISDRYNGMMADRYLRDQQIGIMADRLDSERLRGFCYGLTDGHLRF